MKYALGNMLNGAGGLNPDGLSLDLQFAADKTLTARKGPTPVFTRASTGTFIGSDGLIQTAAANVARFDHDPVTLVCKGLLIEEQRTNDIRGSIAPATQTRTVTAVPYTLSFYGTGTIVLSGVHVATVNGTGAYPTRAILTFTPTAGSLVLTITGSVTNAQLEAGAFATSWIQTTSFSSITRSADVCSITGSGFTGFWNQSAGTLVESFEASPNTNTTYASASNGNIVQNSLHLDNDTGLMRAVYYSGSSLVATLNLGAVGTIGAVNIIATAYSVNDFAASRNGAAVVVDTAGAVPASLTQINIGADERSQTPTSFYSNRCIKSLRYFKKRLPDAKLQTLST
jgi:hypothetical protein